MAPAEMLDAAKFVNSIQDLNEAEEATFSPGWFSLCEFSGGYSGYMVLVILYIHLYRLYIYVIYIYIYMVDYGYGC